MSLRESLLATLRWKVDGGRDARPTRVPFTCYAGLMAPEAWEIENLAPVYAASAFRTELVDAEVTQTSRELAPGVRETTMATPWGTLTQVAHTETGYGSAWTKEHWIKRPEDYRVIEQITRHTRVIADPAPVQAALEQAGDRGVVMMWMNRTPFQRIWIENTGMERLAFDLVDAPAAVEALYDAFFEQSREIMRATAQAAAELVWVPDNITGEMTGPPVFRKYLTPYYRAVCETLLPAGKLPCCHMDGMLRQIADCIAETDLPVMEAFTPPPDGNFSVAEARDRWPEKALWLNFPSSVHLAEPDEVERATRELVAQNAGRPGFAVGITENIPASVGARSLQAIGKALA